MGWGKHAGGFFAGFEVSRPLCSMKHLNLPRLALMHCRKSGRGNRTAAQKKRKTDKQEKVRGSLCVSLLC